MDMRELVFRGWIVSYLEWAMCMLTAVHLYSLFIYFIPPRALWMLGKLFFIRASSLAFKIMCSFIT